MSNLVTKKVWLTFPSVKTREAIICDMYDQFKVRFNLRQASVTSEVGVIALELESTPEKIEEAIRYFESRGLTVEPVEMDVVAG
ncbi:MAG: NIL domain-containing protein [Deltaproteobacteria bacterium]|nr:NIL domain-containing protein [Deltaproteobacteria bacterium]